MTSTFEKRESKKIEIFQLIMCEKYKDLKKKSNLMIKSFFYVANPGLTTLFNCLEIR